MADHSASLRCAIDNCDQPDPGAIDTMGIVSAYVLKRYSWGTVVVLTMVFCTSPVTDAAPRLEDLARQVGVQILADATSDKEVLETARKRIPYKKMSSNAQARAAHIVDNVSQYRRMPSLQYPVDADIYQYLVNHPDAAISTWRVMGISTLQMWRTDDFRYAAKAADGSAGTADILWRDGNQCLFIVEGTYRSPLLPGSIQAAALVWVQYRFVQAPDGSLLVNQQVETFLHFPSTTIDALARLTSRLTNSILDRNVFEVSLYARMMAKAAEKEPEWIEQLARQMDGVSADQRTELVMISRHRRSVADLRPVSSSTPRRSTGLPESGEFDVFERSLQQVIVHVPLVPPVTPDTSTTPVPPTRHKVTSGGSLTAAESRDDAHLPQVSSADDDSNSTATASRIRLAVEYGSSRTRMAMRPLPTVRNAAIADLPATGRVTPLSSDDED